MGKQLRRASHRNTELPAKEVYGVNRALPLPPGFATQLIEIPKDGSAVDALRRPLMQAVYNKLFDALPPVSKDQLQKATNGG